MWSTDNCPPASVLSSLPLLFCATFPRTLRTVLCTIFFHLIDKYKTHRGYITYLTEYMRFKTQSDLKAPQEPAKQRQKERNPRQRYWHGPSPERRKRNLQAQNRVFGRVKAGDEAEKLKQG